MHSYILLHVSCIMYACIGAECLPAFSAAQSSLAACLIVLAHLLTISLLAAALKLRKLSASCHGMVYAKNCILF